MRKNQRPARAPPGPQHINFWGWERATPARSASSGKGLPSPTASAPSAARSDLPERGTKRGDLPNDVERLERTIRPVRLRHPTAHFGVWAGSLSSNRRGEPVDVRGPSHTIVIDAPWPRSIQLARNAQFRLHEVGLDVTFGPLNVGVVEVLSGPNGSDPPTGQHRGPRRPDYARRQFL
jgi:hypothetical protein